MTSIATKLGRVLMIAVPLALGVGAVYFAGNLRKLPETATTTRPAVPVRVITLAPTRIIPRVTGYGSVEPVREWRAIARIEGAITQVATSLAPGEIVAKDTLLFRIDNSDLKLQLAQIDAQTAASKVKDATIEASLEIAGSDLALARDNLTRQEQLGTQGVVTQTALENARRQELAARTKVTELGNQITLNAAERAVLAAQRATLERSIGFADIRAPYDLRVSALSADIGQFVTRGQTLLTGEGTDAADISAQFPIGRIGPMLRLAGNGLVVTDLSARVRLPARDHTVIWPAKVERMGEAIDPRTQSAPVVVRVTDPQARSEAGKRPPLRRNMFVEVELSAPEQEALVVPVEAVQAGIALVVTPEGTLARRPVETGFTLGDLLVVTKGLETGDRVVLTDPSIAVPGMAVQPVEDETRKAGIAAEAIGASPAAPQPGSGQAGGQGGGQGGGMGGGKDKDKSDSGEASE